MTVQFDATTKLAISTGRSRYEKNWKNQEVTWEKLVNRLKDSKETPEKLSDYMKLSKDEQDKIKDIGGFVGGHINGGRRQAGSIECRQIITLDLDTPPANIWDDIMDNMSLDYAMLMYSTHKHGPGNPRYRLIIPLDRKVSPDEYEAIARKIAEKIGIDYCDDSTFQASRLMYWPSHASDAAPAFEFYDAPILHADDILDEYEGHWDDTSYWPESSRQPGIRKALAAKQGNPMEKKGIVGAFCRVYDVPAAIDRYLPGVYVPTGHSDRYTYAKGSSSGGLAIYQSGLFAYSNHATDPAGGHLCNAFDLVRIHLYGDRDDPAAGLSGAATASYKAMADMALQDPAVLKQLDEDQQASSVLDFKNEEPPQEDAESPSDGSDGAGGNDTPDDLGGSSTASQTPKKGHDMSWLQKIERGKNGACMPTIVNATLILKSHPLLAAIKYNELSRAIEIDGKLPWPTEDKYWSEADEAQLYAWCADRFGVQFPDNQFRRALTIAAYSRKFNPIKDYIYKLPAWDGTPRIDTLFVDYLGAPATPYTAAVTRATLIGGIKRALEPGCKHDTILVLDGRPGIGKSTILAKLGTTSEGCFYSDSLSLADTKDKTAAEKIQGVWIMEIGEMQGGRKADIDNIKSFISRQVDEYRPAYGKIVERRPRTAIIWGTTNNTDGFLRDTTGNRRYWPVKVSGKGSKSVWEDLTDAERDQIWAEAYEAYKNGEPNYLSPEMEREAEKAQQSAMEADDRTGLVEDYLDTKLPGDFYDWDASKRADYFLQPDHYAEEHDKATTPRTFISPIEIWCECFGKPLNRWERKNAYEIASIMACIPGWTKTGERHRINGYGVQRCYVYDTEA